MCYYLFTASKKFFYSYPNPTSIKENVLTSERLVRFTYYKIKSRFEHLCRKYKIIILKLNTTMFFYKH